MYDIYSESGKNVRYVLGTKGGNTLIVFGINPSTATAEKSDPTISRIDTYLKKYGYVVTLRRGGRGGAGTYAVNHRIFWRGTYSGLKRSAFPPDIGITGPYADVMFGGVPLKKQKIPSAIWKNQVLRQAEQEEQEEKTS